MLWENRGEKEDQAIKSRADNLRSQANRLTSIARNTHSVSCKPLAHNMGRPTHVEEPRACNTRHTDLAFKTSSVKLGYALGGHGAYVEKDADDGGQELLNEYLGINIYDASSCPKLLQLATKFKDIAVSCDANHISLAKAETKAANACPKKGIKKMSKAIGSLPSNALKYVRRDGKTQDGKPEGSFTANATTIDGIITRAWQSIFSGNVEDPKKCLDNFLQKHGRSLLKQEESPAPDITVERVYQTL